MELLDLVSEPFGLGSPLGLGSFLGGIRLVGSGGGRSWGRHLVCVGLLPVEGLLLLMSDGLRLVLRIVGRKKDLRRVQGRRNHPHVLLHHIHHILFLALGLPRIPVVRGTRTQTQRLAAGRLCVPLKLLREGVVVN